MNNIAAVIVAAGSGTRFKSDTPKQYHILNNKTILQRTIEKFIEHPRINRIIVVINANDQERYLACNISHPKIHSVVGGVTRQESVFCGLQALNNLPPKYVLIHDAARPFVSHELIYRVIWNLEDSAVGCIPILDIQDTVKRINKQYIAQTIDRDQLCLVQTPQGFDYQLLLNAHEKLQNSLNFTDDASLFEAMDLPVATCSGNRDNIKVTYPQDLEKMDHINYDVRVGNGFDVHQLVPGKGMRILGVWIAGDSSLKGHSDADVALHSLTDAILGAIADGDIGVHFPPNDEKWKGADSTQFLIYALERMRYLNGRLNHVDITLIGEQPKFSPYREQFLSNLEQILGIRRDRIGLKATTTEKLGFLGRGEGLAVQTTATVIF